MPSVPIVRTRTLTTPSLFTLYKPMVEGRCAREFDAVRVALDRQLAASDELGAAVAVIVDGETVVDIWGGWADRARSRRWRPDTLVNVYSVGKPMVALLLLQLVDQGRVDLDDRVAEWWPAFAAYGKGEATLRQALCHQAGVPAIREPLTNQDLWDFDRMCAALAATEPWWTAGTRHAYHTNTFGHLIGGIVRQITGELPGARLQTMCEPLQADVHIGLVDDHHPRCAEVHFDLPEGPHGENLPIDPDAPGLEADTRMTLLGYANPPGYSSIGVVNTPQWRRAQIPSTNGHMTAKGIARLYQGVLSGAVLSEDLLAEATRPQSTGFCPTLGQEVTFGLGFQPWTPVRPLGRTPAGFGHYGTGGSLGLADPSVGMAFGYVTSHVVPRWQSPYNRDLVDAAYASLR